MQLARHGVLQRTLPGCERRVAAAVQCAAQGRKGPYLHGWQRSREESNEDIGRQTSKQLPKKGPASSELGWWETQDEGGEEPTTSFQLEDWQEKKLVAAYAAGRRRIPVLYLSKELGIDRSSLLDWVKEFSAKPEKDREAALAKVEPAMLAQAVAAQAAAKSEAAQAAAKSEAKVSAAAKSEAKDSARKVSDAAVGLTPLAEEESKGAGFIPYYTRKEMGMENGKGKKRLSAETLRTLESIYTRTDFPSKDVIKGLWDLHKLPREAALEWFEQRRAIDGVTSSTQKRRKKRNSPLDVDEGGEIDSRRGDEMLIAFMGDAAPLPQKPDAPAVEVPISKSQMAALRSSMPSPKKFKGKKLAEEMGIKSNSDGETSSTTIGSVKYVEMPDSKRSTWSNAWRFRNAAPGAGKPITLKIRDSKKDSGK